MNRFRFFSTVAFLLLLCPLYIMPTHAEEIVCVASQTDLADAVAALAESGGIIQITADINLTKSLSLPANRAHITIDGGGHTVSLGGNLALNGDMDIQNICFRNVGTYRSIPCGGHVVHFHDTVTCEKTDDAYPSIMAGFTASNAYSGGKLTIDGGTWQRVRGGNAGTGSVLQSGSVVINGGKFIEKLQVGGAGQMASGSDIRMTVNGGTLEQGIVFFTTTGTANANTVLILNGGSIKGKIRISDSVGTLNGHCELRLNGGDFSACTGIFGYSGGGNLTVKCKIDKTLYSTVYDLNTTDTLSTTLLHTGMADPCMVYANGYYYLTATGTSRIGLIKSATLSGIAEASVTSNYIYKSAEDITATDTLGYTEVNGTWSPELHYFSADDFGKAYAGWYMYLAIRNKTEANDSSDIRMVTLKSASADTPDGPYVHPTDRTTYKSQLLLDKSGEPITEWGCGQSILRIESGSYKGIYVMWVAEEDRGTASFRQKIMIAKMKNPWQLSTDPVAILYPTQYWETIGSGYNGTKYLPAVVEGATAIYGKDGQIYIIYCGSGYWTNYGLGQLTWNGCDPLSAASWIKYANNPVFSANDAAGNHYTEVPMQGVGHAFFVKSAANKLYAVYHAYPSDSAGNKDTDAKRNAYIEPCYIDYTLSNGVNQGVLRFDIAEDRPAATDTAVTFTTRYGTVKFSDLPRTDGMTVSVYDIRYDRNHNGDCEIADVLLLLREVLNGSTAFSLADVLNILAYIAD